MDKSWANLASRVVRVALARKDIKPAALSALLADEGVIYSNKVLTERMSRGHVSFADFLGILHVIEHDVSLLWQKSYEESDGFVVRAKKVIEKERGQRPNLTAAELVQMMLNNGAEIRRERLEAEIQSGELLLRDFLILLFCLGSTSLEGFLCAGDILNVAKKAGKGVAPGEEEKSLE